MVLVRRLVLSASLLVLGFVGGAAAQPMCGAFDCDGDVQATDALAVLKYAVGESTTLYCNGCEALPTTTSTLADGGRYRDTGLTIIDLLTGLEWEKKNTARGGGVDLGNLHATDNRYSWYEITGSWIAAMNDEAFAGHSDWRVPTLDELLSIIDDRWNNPAIHPVFGPTVPSFYWSSSELTGSVVYAWNVNFADGFSTDGTKAGAVYARAVRFADIP